MAKVFDFKRFTELIVFFLILATTVHAQDFQDVDGDREVGRNTLPMMFPTLSRVTMLLLLPLWTTLVISFCHPPLLLGVVYLLLSLIVGVRFFVFRRSEDDEWTYFVYNVSTLWYIIVTFFADFSIEGLALLHDPPPVPFQESGTRGASESQLSNEREPFPKLLRLQPSRGWNYGT
jgi:1,4-dihydroxy-2-naphthoate octaprenyltransferase